MREIIVAVGWPSDPISLPDHLRERELASRQRKPIDAFACPARRPLPAEN